MGKALVIIAIIVLATALPPTFAYFEQGKDKGLRNKVIIPILIIGIICIIAGVILL